MASDINIPLLSDNIREFSKIFAIPFTLMDGNDILITHGPVTLTPAFLSSALPFLSHRKDAPSYYVSPDFLMTGRIHAGDSGLSILMGPAYFKAPEEEDLLKIFKRAKEYAPDLTFMSLRNYFSNVLPIGPDRFLSLLSSLDGLINRRFFSPEKITGFLDQTPSFYTEIVSSEKLRLLDEKPRQTDNYRFESQLLYYVKNGMISEIQSLGAFTGYLPSLGSTSLSATKNALIILNTLCIRAAISGGVEPSVSYAQGELFLHQIESATTINQLLILNQTQNIPVQYASLVKSTQTPSTGDVKVDAAISYLHNHYQENVTVKELADTIALSPEYLSTLFKKKAGKSIPAYLSELKIKSAKAMLMYSDATLAEISSVLSFSSQAYFQTVFKKVTGQTPAAFRQNAAQNAEEFGDTDSKNQSKSNSFNTEAGV